MKSAPRVPIGSVLSLPILSTSILLLLCSSFAFGQSDVLYDNGADPGNIGYQPVNLGYSTTNSFVISGDGPVILTKIVLYLYDADDLNKPLRLEMKLTKEAFGDVIAQGQYGLTLLAPPVDNHFLFETWQVGLFPNLYLQPGTYYLQLQNVESQFATFVYWGQSNGMSLAYTEKLADADNIIQPVGSEAFQIYGHPYRKPP